MKRRWNSIPSRTVRRLALVRRIALFGAALALAPAPQAAADVVYFGLQNVAIPFGLGGAAFDGVFLDLETGVTGTNAISGWDINPFFGGALVANSPSFQPARVGANDGQPILALTTGVTVGHGLFPLTGPSDFNGSEGHLGDGSGQFHSGQEAYLGFRFLPTGCAGHHYGWMRVIFTANTPGGLIKDWAYETSGTAIQTGNVLRTAPALGVSVVTLSGDSELSSTLSFAVSDLTDSVTEVVKTGEGAWTFSGEHNFTGRTTVETNGGTLHINGRLSATAAVAVNVGGTLLLNGPGGENAKLNPTATVTLGGGKIDLGGLTSSLDQSVGALTLSANSTLDFGMLVTGHVWSFGASPSNWSGLELRILNYTPGTDHLFFGTNTTSLAPGQLSRVTFFSDGGSTSLGFGQFTGAFGEVIPVPEPSGVAIGIGLLGFAFWREQYRARKHRRSA